MLHRSLLVVCALLSFTHAALYQPPPACPTEKLDFSVKLAQVPGVVAVRRIRNVNICALSKSDSDFVTKLANIVYVIQECHLHDPPTAEELAAATPTAADPPAAEEPLALAPNGATKKPKSKKSKAPKKLRDSKSALANEVHNLFVKTGLKQVPITHIYVGETSDTLASRYSRGSEDTSAGLRCALGESKLMDVTIGVFESDVAVCKLDEKLLSDWHDFVGTQVRSENTYAVFTNERGHHGRGLIYGFSNFDGAVKAMQEKKSRKDGHAAFLKFFRAQPENQKYLTKKDQAT